MKQSYAFFFHAVLFAVCMTLGISSHNATAAGAVREFVAPHEFVSLINSGRPVIVDFYAEWCGPCKALAPEFIKLAEAHPNITFIKVNVDQYKDLTATYGVRALPTIIFFKDGKEVAREVGNNGKSALENSINRVFPGQ